MLSICAWCQRFIRENPITGEKIAIGGPVDMSLHQGQEFSHGMCQECKEANGMMGKVETFEMWIRKKSAPL